MKKDSIPNAPIIMAAWHGLSELRCLHLRHPHAGALGYGAKMLLTVVGILGL